jgi:ABC-type branched-subunit amino acid transport system ATPase component
MKVIENLMLVPSNQTGENVWMSWINPWKISREESQILENALEILDFLKLSHLKDEYAGNLSTGQKKLLELARTLMAKPKMILLDEPGAGVNPTLMNSLVKDIERSRDEKNITFLLIEHDMDLVMRLCDPVIVMSNGGKLAEGTPSEIRSNKQVIEAYLGTSE